VAQQHARRRLVGRAGYVVHVAGPNQGVDVGLVRLRRHGITQEDHQVELASGQARADLQVTAERTAEQPLAT
jgi:hypothetical protein